MCISFIQRIKMFYFLWLYNSINNKKIKTYQDLRVHHSRKRLWVCEGHWGLLKNPEIENWNKYRILQLLWSFFLIFVISIRATVPQLCTFGPLVWKQVQLQSLNQFQPLSYAKNHCAKISEGSARIKVIAQKQFCLQMDDDANDKTHTKIWPQNVYHRIKTK